MMEVLVIFIFLTLTLTFTRARSFSPFPPEENSTDQRIIDQLTNEHSYSKFINVVSRHRSEVDSEGCRNGMIMDANVSECVPQMCAPDFTIVDQRCVDNKPKRKIFIENPTFSRCLDGSKPSLTLFHRGVNRSSLLDAITSFTRVDRVMINLEYYEAANGTITEVKFLHTGEFWNAFANQSIRNETFENVDRVLISSVSPFVTIRNSQVYDKFPSTKLCARKEKLDMKSHDFDISCNAVPHKGDLYDDILLQLVITKHESIPSVYKCTKYFTMSDCLLRPIATDNVTFDADQNLHYETISGKHLTYPLGEYLPMQDGGYAVCIYGVKPRKTKVIQPVEYIRKVEPFVSFIGACISPLCYIFVLATFRISKEHFPGYGLISLCTCLLLSDVLFLSAIILDVTNTSLSDFWCKSLGAGSHFAFLLVQLSVVVLGVDNALTFRKLQFRSRETAASYYQTRSITVLVPSAVTVIGALLDYTGFLSAGYGENGVCLVHSFTVRSIFYMGPAVVSFIVAISLMLFTLCKLRRQAEPMRGSANNSNIICPNIRVVALKLILTYGLTEVVGFIQIPGERSRDLNGAFAFAYTCMRSFRGLAVLLVYVSRRSVLLFYWTHIKELGRKLDKRIQDFSNSDTEISEVKGEVFVLSVYASSSQHSDADGDKSEPKLETIISASEERVRRQNAKRKSKNRVWRISNVTRFFRFFHRKSVDILHISPTDEITAARYIPRLTSKGVVHNFQTRTKAVNEIINSNSIDNNLTSSRATDGMSNQGFESEVDLDANEDNFQRETRHKGHMSCLHSLDNRDRTPSSEKKQDLNLPDDPNPDSKDKFQNSLHIGECRTEVTNISQNSVIDSLDDSGVFLSEKKWEPRRRYNSELKSKEEFRVFQRITEEVRHTESQVGSYESLSSEKILDPVKRSNSELTPKSKLQNYSTLTEELQKNTLPGSLDNDEFRSREPEWEPRKRYHSALSPKDELRTFKEIAEELGQNAITEFIDSRIFSSTPKSWKPRKRCNSELSSNNKFQTFQNTAGEQRQTSTIDSEEVFLNGRNKMQYKRYNSELSSKEILQNSVETRRMRYHSLLDLSDIKEQAFSIIRPKRERCYSQLDSQESAENTPTSSKLIFYPVHSGSSNA